jgi:heme exporter protein D
MPELNFDSWQAFFQMGGYALYVWISFGSTYLLLALLAWRSHRSQQQFLQNLAAKQAREQRIRQQQQQEHTE